MYRKKSIKRKIDENAEEKFKARIAGDDSKEDDAEEFEIKILPGTGRISSSGTVIMGHFTEFMNQLKPGDAIIITHPTRCGYASECC